MLYAYIASNPVKYYFKWKHDSDSGREAVQKPN